MKKIKIALLILMCLLLTCLYASSQTKTRYYVHAVRVYLDSVVYKPPSYKHQVYSYTYEESGISVERSVISLSDDAALSLWVEEIKDDYNNTVISGIFINNRGKTVDTLYIRKVNKLYITDNLE